MNNPTFKKNQLKESSMKPNNKGVNMNQTYFDEKLYQYLTDKYSTSVLTKKQLAAELCVSVSTINNYIGRGEGLPSYFKRGGINSKVFFKISSIVSFLSNTVNTKVA